MYLIKHTKQVVYAFLAQYAFYVLYLCKIEAKSYTVTGKCVFGSKLQFLLDYAVKQLAFAKNAYRYGKSLHDSDLRRIILTSLLSLGWGILLYNPLILP